MDAQALKSKLTASGTRKAIAECESRYEAYKNGEMGSVDALAAIGALRTKFVK